MARLLHLTDLHAVAPGQLVCGELDTPALLNAAIDTLLERRTALGPLDAVLVTGDISDDGSAESYDFARAALERLDLPLLVVPGNHDRREAFQAGFADLPMMPAKGYIDWQIDLADSLIIGLDTLVEGQGGGRLRDESLAFLRACLTTAGDRPVIIALHHPPLTTGVHFMDAIGLENPADLLVSLRDFAGRATILAGHVHNVYHGMISGHPVITAPSLCSAFAPDQRKDAPTGFYTGPLGCAVIDTAPDRGWTHFPLDHSNGPFPFT